MENTDIRFSFFYFLTKQIPYRILFLNEAILYTQKDIFWVE